MPFKSKAQARWMFATHPEMAHTWAEHTLDMKKLPERADSPLSTEKSATSFSIGDRAMATRTPNSERFHLKFAETGDHPDRPTDQQRMISSIPFIGGAHTLLTSPEGHTLPRWAANVAGGTLGSRIGSVAGNTLSGGGLGGTVAGSMLGNFLGTNIGLRTYDDHFFPQGAPGTADKQANDAEQGPDNASRLWSSAPFIGLMHSIYASPEGHKITRPLANFAGALGGELIGAPLGLALPGNFGGSYGALHAYDKHYWPEQFAEGKEKKATALPGVSEDRPDMKRRMISSLPLVGLMHSIYDSPDGHKLTRPLANYGGALGGEILSHLAGVPPLAGNMLGSLGALHLYDKHYFPEHDASMPAKTAAKIPGINAESFPGGMEEPRHGSAPVNIARARHDAKPERSKQAGLGGTLLAGAKMVPGVGTALGGLQGAYQGYANGEGMKGMLGRGALGAAAGSASIGGPITSAIAGTALQSGADAIGNKLFSRPQPPAPSMLPAGTPPAPIR